MATPCLRERPTVAQQDAPRDFMASGGCQEFTAHSDLGPTLRGPVRHGGGVHPDSVHGLVEPCAGLLRGGERAVGTVVVDTGFPGGACFIAPRPAAGQWQADGAADRMPRDGLMGERVRVLALLVRTGHRVDPTPSRRAPGIIENQERVRLRSTPLAAAGAETRRSWTRSGHHGAAEKKRERVVLSALASPPRVRCARLLLARTSSPVKSC
jgi:hypothetical protein